MSTMPGSKRQSLHQQHRPSAIQPMTGLYLREFFANYFLNADIKQIKNMYSTSLQVLNSLIEEYEYKLGAKQTNFDRNHPKELGFEQFYNRLKTIFQFIQQKFLNSQQNDQSHKEKEWFSGENSPLFSQKQTIGYGSQASYLKIQKKSQKYTDDELYQLVVQLKQQNNRKTQRIQNLEKQMLQKVSQLKLLGQNYKQQSKQAKNKDQVISKAVHKEIKLTNQKIQLQTDLKQIKQKCDQIDNTNKCITEQNESKYKQIQRLAMIQTLNLKNIDENSILNCKLTSSEENQKNLYNKLKISVQNQRILSAKLVTIQIDNTRLKNIILNKLRFLNTVHPGQTIKDKIIKSSQVSQNTQTFQKPSSSFNQKRKSKKGELQSIKKTGMQNEKENIGVNSQTHNEDRFIERLIQEKISNKHLINSIVETQLGKFVSNLIKTQPKYQPNTKQTDQNVHL